MPKARIAAVRFRSLLANRNLTADMVAARVTTAVRPHELIQEDTEVEFEDLIELARVFSRPYSYLLIDAAEIYPSTGSDNRTYENQLVSLSPELLDELQFADLMLDAAVDLFPGEGYRVPIVSSTSVPTALVASDVRSLLGVSLDVQLRARDGFAALRIWLAALNGLGVYVAQRNLRDPTVRAFSKVKDDQAVIVVSTKDDPHPRIFSLIHEYCHVALHSTGICDLLDFRDVERYCNQITANVLLPHELLDRLLVPGQFDGSDEDSDAVLRSLSNRTHVSQQALLIMLRERSIISRDLFDEMESRRAVRRRNGAASGSGGPNYYTVAINKVGRMFASRVVDTLREGVIDREDASVLLGVGEHNVSNFIHQLSDD